MDYLVKKVAEAIDAVQLFSRLNDFSDAMPGFPVEICRFGRDGEPEIVVLKRLRVGTSETDALREAVSEHRARAAIEAIRNHAGDKYAEWKWSGG